VWFKYTTYQPALTGRGIACQEPPNALGISGGAPVDRERGRADSSFQNATDLAGAERRPLQHSMPSGHSRPEKLP